MLHVSIRVIASLELCKLHAELLPMLCLKVFIWNLFKAETVVPSVEDCFNEVLLESLDRVLFPKVLHLINRTLREQILAYDSCIGIMADL